MRSENGFGYISSTVTKSGCYTNVPVNNENSNQSFMLKVHQDSFRLGCGIPSGFCVYAGVVQGEFVQIDARSASYFRYVSRDDEGERARACMELCRFLIGVSNLRYQEYENILNQITKSKSDEQYYGSSSD